MTRGFRVLRLGVIASLLASLLSAGVASLTLAAIGPAYQLAFVPQPSTAVALQIMPAVTVQVQDQSGTLVTSGTYQVTIAIGSMPTGITNAKLHGTTTETSVNGVATFSDLWIDKAGAGYTFTASATGLVGATSASFTVTSGTNQLVFLTQPGGGAAGAVWGQQPVVAVEDSLGHVVTTDNSTVVTLAIGTNPAGGALSCTGGLAKQVVAGLATFTGCSISIASSSYYTLSATSSPPKTPATSAGFLVGSSNVTFTTATALDRTTVGPFTVSTKIQKVGGYITWKMDGGPAVAGKTVQIWVYKKYSSTGSWSGPTLLTTRVADAHGVAYASIYTGGVLWLSARPVLPDTTTSSAVWGPTAIGRWTK